MIELKNIETNEKRMKKNVKELFVINHFIYLKLKEFVEQRKSENIQIITMFKTNYGYLDRILQCIKFSKEFKKEFEIEIDK